MPLLFLFGYNFCSAITLFFFAHKKPFQKNNFPHQNLFTHKKVTQFLANLFNL
ncbi:hypothetical protein O59_003616 [Cellvibrio sp. BR]|nr:hypothetical protein O59_003616 [Cellvibrio sp. BR]